MRHPFFALLLALVVALYFHGLGSPRIYLSVEEVLQALQAHTIATSGRDLVGRWLPVYPAEPWYEAGRDPLWVYATAALLQIASFSEWIVRATSAAAGVLNVVLMYLLARQIFGGHLIPITAAALLAMTPAHFFQSRLATSQIGPITFVLAWLLFLAKYLQSGRGVHIVAAAASLGLGVYSYLSAVFLMPICFLVTLALVPRQHWRATFATFFIAMVPFFAWHVAHPERIGHLLGYYTANGYNADLANPMPLHDRVLARVDALWTALSPAAMFFTGDGNLRFSTQHSGHFLLPMFVLLLVGLATLHRQPLRQLRSTIIAGLAVTPLPAVLAMNGEIKRWLAFIPFAILVAAAGVHWLASHRRPTARLLAIVLVALSTIQFGAFLRDYWTGYRERSFFFYGGDMGAAVRLVLDRAEDPRCVMFDRRVPVLDHWLLYTRVRELDASAQEPTMIDADSGLPLLRPDCRQSGLLVHEHIASMPNGLESQLLARGWQKIQIPEPGNRNILTLFWYDANR